MSPSRSRSASSGETTTTTATHPHPPPEMWAVLLKPIKEAPWVTRAGICFGGGGSSGTSGGGRRRRSLEGRAEQWGREGGSETVLLSPCEYVAEGKLRQLLLSSPRFPSLFFPSFVGVRVAAAPWGSNACPPSAPCSLVGCGGGRRGRTTSESAVERGKGGRRGGRSQWRRGERHSSRGRRRISAEGGTPRRAAGGRQLRFRWRHRRLALGGRRVDARARQRKIEDNFGGSFYCELRSTV